MQCCPPKTLCHLSISPTGIFTGRECAISRKPSSCQKEHVWVEATYENTINNPRNPNSPPANGGLGEATTDDMMLVYITRMLYKTGDKNILIDSSWNTAVPNLNTQKLMGVSVYPNPANDGLTLEFSQAGSYQLVLFDVAGNRVWTEQVQGERKSEIQVSQLAAGVYFYRVQGKGCL